MKNQSNFRNRSISDPNDEAGLLFQGLFGGYFDSLGDSLDNPKAYIALSRQKYGERMHNEFYADMYFAECRAADLREQRVNAFFAVAPRSRTSRKQGAIRDILTLHVDVDQKGLSVERKLNELKPSALVHSGNGFHVYFFLDVPVPAAQGPLIRELNRRLAMQVGGDFNATDTARILRIPGTFNLKEPDRPKLVELVECNPSLRYPLDYLIERFGPNLQNVAPEPALRLIEDATSLYGRFLGSDERIYVERLLHGGLFERQSRNTVTLLLCRYCLEQRMSKFAARDFIIGFFENNHNGLSEDWLRDREECIRHIEIAVENCWQKAPKWIQTYRGRKTTANPRKLSKNDLDYIESLQLNARDSKFLNDALTFILNEQREGVIVLETRKIMEFRYCHSRNYKERYSLLEQLGFLKLKAMHRRATRLGAEFYVLYTFQEDVACEYGRLNTFTEDMPLAA